MRRGRFVILIMISLIVLFALAYEPKLASKAATRTATPTATANLTPVATPIIQTEPTIIDEPDLNRIFQLVELALQATQSTASVAESTLERVDIFVTLGVAIVGGLAVLSGLFTYRRAKSIEEMVEHTKQIAEEAEQIAEESSQSVKCSIEVTQEMLSEAQQETMKHKETLSIARRDLDSLKTSLGRVQATLDRFEVITGKDPAGRLAAAQRLTQSADPSVTPTLFFLLNTDEDSRIREAAAYGLGFQKARTALESLMECSQDENPYVRKQCAWALGEIIGSEHKAAIKRLEEIAKDDPDPNVRKAAEEALKKALGTKK